MDTTVPPDQAGRTPFADFAADVQVQPPLRAAITRAYRRPESECIPPLLDLATVAQAQETETVARKLVENLRKRSRTGGVEGLVHEYSLSSEEGVALMCLAEALLRIPDDATRDALIRDKIAGGDWRSHLGHSPSAFVNAATWGLVLTGKLVAPAGAHGLSNALTRLIARGGEPLIRRGVDMAMRMLGEQFVTGQTIAEALANARGMEARGFSYSYDMLGEAALTETDAARYLSDYAGAIHAIGHAADGRGVYDGPGISIKLSAIHPRYVRSQRSRVVAELLPRLKALALLARQYDIGLNIDAEEQDRLDLSLDLLEALAVDGALSGWNGLGFVVQAYGKRAPFVLDWLIDLARRTGRRLMVRLVKGAYWDTEIKRAQVDGLADYPVFTRKNHTDVSYLACARKLLAATDAVFPQFATHNAQTLASIVAMAGPDFHHGLYEFQCLHGMGEPLYEEVVGPGKLNRPCRIYAPVGTHDTLLAYLVRRLLENGANSSFVNRVADEAVPVAMLVADPATVLRNTNPRFTPHPQIALPRDLFGPERRNSAGLDMSDEQSLAGLAARLDGDAHWAACPSAGGSGEWEPIRNPADRRDIVGHVQVANPADIDGALSHAAGAAAEWDALGSQVRGDILRRAANLFEAGSPALVGLMVREAGKTYANAVGEVREAVDFLRYYALSGERLPPGKPLGVVACVSPWNFPLSIFTGQVAAALASGNVAVAKPAEETPLTAAEAVRLLHKAGVPSGVLQILPGDGETGAALVADARVSGVLFTGSNAAARAINRSLAERPGPDGQPVPLVAETGGQNVMVVDSSALTEQVVNDVLVSAFDSAGQRCSALRILCLQDEVATRVFTMLKGAVRELSVGNPARLSTDVGPVITDAARDVIENHIALMQSAGFPVERGSLPAEAANGSFVPPTVIGIRHLADVPQEVFGPVLHVLHYKREDLDQVLAEIRASGYGLTFGLHTRIDETIAHVTERVGAGNIYVNRNMIGAVVGVQPFGGSGLSGTGPKAGGPLYLQRLRRPLVEFGGPGSSFMPAADLALPGPVGERNTYVLRPRGRIGVVAATASGMQAQLDAIAATGNKAVIERDDQTFPLLPPGCVAHAEFVESLDTAEELRAVLFEGESDQLLGLTRRMAGRDGTIVPVLAASGNAYAFSRLMEERSVSINTTASGGNASLMSLE